MDLPDQAGRLHTQLQEHGRAGNWPRAFAVAAELIALLEREPSARDRDELLANTLAIRSYLHASNDDFRQAIADSRHALSVLGSPQPDPFVIAPIQFGLIQHLALAGETEEIRRLDRGPITTYRSVLRQLGDDAADLAIPLSQGAAGLHSIGEHEEACAYDREALAAFSSQRGTLDPETREYYAATALNLAQATPSATESRDTAKQAIDLLCGLMNEGRFSVAGGLIEAMLQHGRALRRLGVREAVRSFVDAEFVLNCLQPAIHELRELAPVLEAEITPAEKEEGWYITKEVAVMVGDWMRQLGITFRP